MMSPSPRLVGLACAVAAPLCWSVGGLVMRSVAAAPWDIVFWRSAGAVLAFPLLLLLLGASSLRDMRHAGWRAPLLVACIVGTLTLHVLAMSRTSVANVLIVQSISPFLVAVLAHLLLGERPGRVGWIVIAAAFAGLVPVLGGSLFSAQVGGRLDGDLLALGVALCSATMATVVRGARGLNLLPATPIACAVTCVGALPLGATLATGVGGAAALMALGVVQLTLGISFFFLALRRLPASQVTLIALLEPVLGPLWVWLALGEEPPAATLVGGAVVLTALVTNAVVFARRPLPAPAP
jgi:drug/metabolite transporter (DMT)-like permease